MEIRSIRGMNDIFAPNIYAWRYIENYIKNYFENWGFSEIKTPVVESTSLFARGVGDSTDIVQKEMYTFLDRNQDSLTLRPEATASVVRATIEHGLLNQNPLQKLFYWGSMYRYERPQKGRYREFYQYGIEILGAASSRQDAELITMLMNMYDGLKLSGLSVELNSLGCDECRPPYKQKIEAYFRPLASQLCQDCQGRLSTNPLRILDCKVPTCKELTKGAPAILDILCTACDSHFKGVLKDLDLMKTPYTINKRLVRGLDYYNRTLFEITTNDLGSQNAICGGGRYDKLVEKLGGPSTPAVGFAGGVERLFLLLEKRVNEFVPKTDVFLVTPDEVGQDPAYSLAHALRQKGCKVEMDYEGKSMKSQMKRADKIGARYALIIGGNELSKGEVVLRDLNKQAQEIIKYDSIVEEVVRRLQ